MAEDSVQVPYGPCAHCAYRAHLISFYWAGRTFQLCELCHLTARAGRLVLRRLEDIPLGDEGVTGLLQ